MPTASARRGAHRAAPARSVAPPGQAPLSSHPRPDRLDQLAALMLLASVASGLIHAAVAPEHDDWLPSAVFFAALAAFQLIWAAVVLLRPGRLILAAGALVNLAAVALWLWSRTAGMSFGPHKAVPEPFARTDVLAAVLQSVIVTGALWLLITGRHDRSVPLRAAVANGAIGAVVAGVAAVALSGAAGHAHTPGEVHDNGHQGHPTAPAGPSAPAVVQEGAPVAPATGNQPPAAVPATDANKAPAKPPAPRPVRAPDGHLHEH